MKLNPRTIVVAGATTLLLAAGSSVAAAAVMSDPSPVSSSGVIDGCWTKAEIHGSHVIVLQDQGTACPKGTTAISWNESGPPGPAGPAGPAGPSGPAGAAGSDVLTYGGVSDYGSSCSFFIGPSGAGAADVTISFSKVTLTCVVSGFPANTMPVSIPAGATFDSSTGQITISPVGMGEESYSFLFAVLETQS
jgi:hypothetical protein